MECRENHDLDNLISQNEHIRSMPGEDNALADMEAPPTVLLQDSRLVLERMHVLCGSLTRRTKSLKKRILILALMNAGSITPGEIEVCCAAGGITVPELTRMIDTLRQQMHLRARRKHALQRRRNRAFVELFVMQQRLQRSSDPVERERLQRYCRRSHLKLENARTQLKLVRNQPMHREIAELLQLPVGSVHSAVAALRRISDSLSADTNPLLEQRGLNMLQLPHDYLARYQQQPQGPGNTPDHTGCDRTYTGGSWHFVPS